MDITDKEHENAKILNYTNHGKIKKQNTQLKDSVKVSIINKIITKKKTAHVFLFYQFLLCYKNMTHSCLITTFY